MASNTSIVIYKHDISGVALFASTAVLAYASTSLIVDKLVKRYFPSTSDYNTFFMKTALTGTVLRSYAIRPNETWAGVIAIFICLAVANVLTQQRATDTSPPFLTNLNAGMKGTPKKVIGNDERIMNVGEALSGVECANCLVIGNTGSGKTSMMKGIAWMIENDAFPPDSIFHGKIILSLNLNLLMEGTMYQGVLQGKIHELVTTLKANKGKVILYIDEIHRIFCEGNTHNNPKGNIAELLKPHIEEDVLIVGGTTPADMSQIPEDTAFLRRYEEFSLGPLTVDQCANILESFTNSPKFKQVYPTVAFSKVHFEAIVELTNLTINPNDPKCVVQPSVSIKFLETIAKKIRRDKLDKVTVQLFAQVFGEYFQKAIASHRVNQQQLIALGEKYMHLFLADH